MTVAMHEILKVVTNYFEGKLSNMTGIGALKQVSSQLLQ